MFFTKKPTVKKKAIFYNLKIADIDFEVYKKSVKNLRIAISPPNAEIKISAPFQLSEEKIIKFVQEKLSWIKKTQEKILGKKYILPKKIINEEIHFLFGKKYQIKIETGYKKNSCFIDENFIKIESKKYLNLQKRQKILDNFYREKLKEIIPSEILTMEKIMNVKVKEFGIKKMKTRWGTCNSRAKRIWINLELAKYPISCLRYLITHEMVHFFEKGHNKKFYKLMSEFYPTWKEKKELLNSCSFS